MGVNENTTLSDILKIDGAEKMLSKYQLPCLHCPMAKMEMEKLKIGEVCKMYGIDTKSLLEDLNRIV
ncbi:MAG: hypothetical protein ABIK53_01870 [bacterium]